MGAILRGTTTWVWLALMLLTGVSWWLGGGSDRTLVADPIRITIPLMSMAFFKARLVLVHFMEIGSAPLALRLVCDAWVVITYATVIGLYLLD